MRKIIYQDMYCLCEVAPDGTGRMQWYINPDMIHSWLLTKVGLQRPRVKKLGLVERDMSK